MKEEDLFDDIENMVLEEAQKHYSPKVLDHFQHPRNLGVMENADGSTFMSGICGDTIGIFVGVQDGKISKASFVTQGCGATVACGSAVTSMVKGMPVSDAMKITGKDLIDYLDGLPIDHTHCADLAVNTLHGALEKTGTD